MKISQQIFRILIALICSQLAITSNLLAKSTGLKPLDFESLEFVEGIEKNLQINTEKKFSLEEDVNFYLDASSLIESDNFPQSIQIQVYRYDSGSKKVLNIINQNFTNSRRAKLAKFKIRLSPDYINHDLFFDVYDSSGYLKASFKKYFEINSFGSISEIEPLINANCPDNQFGDCQIKYLLERLKFEVGPSKNLQAVISRENSGQYVVSLPLVKAKNVKIINKTGNSSSQNLGTGIFNFLFNGISKASISWNNLAKSLDFKFGNQATPVLSIAENGKLTTQRIKIEAKELDVNPMDGVIEYDGNNLYFTKNGQRLPLGHGEGISGPQGPAGADGRQGVDGVSGTDVFNVTANIMSNNGTEANYNNDLVIGSSSLDDDGNASHDTRMLFDKSKGAFRVGTVTGTEWDDEQRGENSMAWGYLSTANGNKSTAFGSFVTANSDNSIAIGNGNSLIDRLVNNQAGSLMLGFNSNAATLYIGPSAGGSTTGNIGIGATSPTEKLQVNGNILTTKSYLSYEFRNNTAAANVTVDWNEGNFQKITLDQNVIFAFTAPTSGVGRFVLMLIQDGTGSRTVTWPASVEWPGGTAPTLSTIAGSKDVVTCLYDGTNYMCQIGLDLQ